MVPEPDEAVIRAGVEFLKSSQPDLLIAVGGGSVLDAAKAMRLFYEHPELHAAPSSPCRSSTPASGWPTTRQQSHAVKLIALPTTSGTGSEVSPAAVITVGTAKVTLIDYSLVPDVAIVDPDPHRSPCRRA